MANPALATHDPLAVRAHARVGSVLQERWTLVRLLGLGGAAAVYEARHRNGKRAAVKVLHAVFSGDDNMRQRFLREGYVANKVGHPGVVSVLDDGVDASGCAFLVMDLLEGMSFEDYRDHAGGTLPAGEVLGLIAAVLEVLVVAHDAGIVHRDLKPENLFRTKTGEIKVLDFGIARLLERSNSATATSSQMAMGTPAFMPPEQASARWSDVDARSDIWALGATLLVLTTGLFVHDGNTSMEVLAKTIMYPAEPTRSRAPDVPAPVAEVIDRALAFDKSQRYQSAAAMLEAVRSAQGMLRATGAGGHVSRPELAPVAPLTSVTRAIGAASPSPFNQHPTVAQQPIASIDARRTELASVSAHAIDPRVIHPTVAALPATPTPPKRSALPFVVVGLLGVVAVVSLAGLGLARSIRKSSADAAVLSSSTVATSSAATSPTDLPHEEPSSVPSAAPSSAVAPEAPSAPASSSAEAHSPAPVHSARHAPPPPAQSAAPSKGVGPLTEHL